MCGQDAEPGRSRLWHGLAELTTHGRLIVDLGILALLALTYLSGLLAEGEGLNRFLVHRYAAAALVTLAAIHVCQGRRSLASRLRHLAAPVDLVGRPRPAVLPTRATTWRRARRDLLVGGGAAVLGMLLTMAWRRPDLSVLTELGGDLGLAYHRWSAPSYVGAIGRALSGGGPAVPERRPEPLRVVSLPRGALASGVSLAEAIDRRRSVREYADRPLTIAELGGLLHAAAGLTDPAGLRAAPSAGALYPLETYVVVHRVAGLERGLYRYVSEGHALEVLREVDLREEVLQACLGQEMVGTAGAVFVLSAVFQRTRWKYGERTYRYVLLEAGHVGQNVYLAATALGLGACAVGAFLDDGLNQLLGVDGAAEAALYVLAVGSRA